MPGAERAWRAFERPRTVRCLTIPRDDFLALPRVGADASRSQVLRELARRLVGGARGGLARRRERRRPYTAGMSGRTTKLIAENRRARHDYELLDRVEAGLAADAAPR